jgi:hypothetical protein
MSKRLTPSQWKKLADLMQETDQQIRHFAKEWNVSPSSLFKPFYGLPKLSRSSNSYNLFQKVGPLMFGDELDDLGTFRAFTLSVFTMLTSWVASPEERKTSVDAIYRREKSKRSTAEQMESWTSEMSLLAEAADVKVLEDLRPPAKMRMMREAQKELAAYASIVFWGLRRLMG